MEKKENARNLVLPAYSHVGYVTKNIEKSIKDLQSYFGLKPFKKMTPDYFNKRYHGEQEDFRVQLAFSRVGNMVYELIQVLQGRTIYEDFIDEHGEGIHHLGYEISNLAEWRKAYKKVNIKPIMSAERVGLKWTYFDTPGIIVELLERAPQGIVV